PRRQQDAGHRKLNDLAPAQPPENDRLRRPRREDRRRAFGYYDEGRLDEDGRRRDTEQDRCPRRAPGPRTPAVPANPARPGSRRPVSGLTAGTQDGLPHHPIVSPASTWQA